MKTTHERRIGVHRRGLFGRNYLQKGRSARRRRPDPRVVSFLPKGNYKIQNQDYWELGILDVYA